MAVTLVPYDRALPEVPGRTPYTRPDAYLEKLGEGDYAVRQGRRPSTMFLVEKLRAAVDAWRVEGYPSISGVPRRLFQNSDSLGKLSRLFKNSGQNQGRRLFQFHGCGGPGEEILEGAPGQGKLFLVHRALGKGK